MLERDEAKLKEVKSFKGPRFLYVDMTTGEILGYSAYANDNIRWNAEYSKRIERMTIEDYEFLTDKNRTVNVVTGADLYDSVKWTEKGFEIGDDVINL